jgi:hypothetical protein
MALKFCQDLFLRLFIIVFPELLCVGARDDVVTKQYILKRKLAEECIDYSNRGDTFQLAKGRWKMKLVTN